MRSCSKNALNCILERRYRLIHLDKGDTQFVSIKQYENMMPVLHVMYIRRSTVLSILEKKNCIATFVSQRYIAHNGHGIMIKIIPHLLIQHSGLCALDSSQRIAPETRDHYKYLQACTASAPRSLPSVSSPSTTSISFSSYWDYLFSPTCRKLMPLKKKRTHTLNLQFSVVAILTHTHFSSKHNSCCSQKSEWTNITHL